MRWRRGVGADQVEDRRGQGMGRGPMAMGAGGLGLGGLLLVVVLNFLTGGGGGGVGALPGLDGLPGMPGAQTNRLEGGPDPDADLKEFVSFVVADVQKSWETSFSAAGKRYEHTTLVIFEGATSTGCGTGSSEIGPFYCPADSKVYLDLGFFRELRDRFGAPGDFAQAYVIAHEIGHHVQNILGVSDEVRRAQSENPDDANEMSVRLELQADCMAGVWAHSAFAQNLLEPGDVEEGLGAAAAVGDDRLQRQGGGRVDKESWTHGSSAQRTEWFQNGFDSGDINSCDTF